MCRGDLGWFQRVQPYITLLVHGSLLFLRCTLNISSSRLLASLGLLLFGWMPRLDKQESLSYKSLTFQVDSMVTKYYCCSLISFKKSNYCIDYLDSQNLEITPYVHIIYILFYNMKIQAFFLSFPLYKHDFFLKSYCLKKHNAIWLSYKSTIWPIR